MKKRFSSWLLMGKVATLPVLLQEAHADLTSLIQGGTVGITPSYADIVTNDLHVIALPATQVALNNISTDTASASTSASNSSSSALLCTTSTGTTLPSLISVVVTGVRAGEVAYLVAALDKNDPQNLAVNSHFTVGNRGLVILGTASLTGDAGVVSAISIQVDLAKNSALLATKRFYMQAIAIVSSAAPSSWRASELDTISVGNKQVDNYGNVTAYCV